MFWQITTRDLTHVSLTVDGRMPSVLLAEVACDRAERAVRAGRQMIAAGHVVLTNNLLGLPVEGFTAAELFDLAAELFDCGACLLAEQARQSMGEEAEMPLRAAR